MKWKQHFVRLRSLLGYIKRVCWFYIINTPDFFTIYRSQLVDYGIVSIKQKLRFLLYCIIKFPHVNYTYRQKVVYQKWIKNHAVKGFRKSDDIGITFSLLVLTYNPNIYHFEKSIKAIINQTYKNFELIIIDNNSSNPGFIKRLRELTIDKRIKVIINATNVGISRATKQAFNECSGDFVTFIDHDDLIDMQTFSIVTSSLKENPDTDIFYTDEDKINLFEERFSPFFKPDWSPDLLMSMNYFGHLTIYRKSLMDRLPDLFNPSVEGSQDYDLALKATEKTNKIIHIPEILYHWRVSPNSVASNPKTKIYAHENAKHALEQALLRRDTTGTVEQGNSLGRWHVKYSIDKEVTVTVIIPTLGKNLSMLRNCLSTIINITTYRNYTIVVVDNSPDGHVLNWIERSFSSSLIKCIKNSLSPFNYSQLMNETVTQIDDEFIVLGNDDVLIRTPGWIELMLEQAQRPEVGVVGIKLIFPNNTIQHAGVILGLNGGIDHAFKGSVVQEPHYMDFTEVIRNYSAVTGAWMMTKKSLYMRINGMDYKNLPVSFNDIDYCLRLRELGFSIVYTPYVQATHQESASRIIDRKPKEFVYMNKRWNSIILNDPFYNRNLSKNSTYFSLVGKVL